MTLTSVETVVGKAQTAQAEIETASQITVDELITGLAWAILEPKTNRSLAEQAVRDTGLGNVDDKIIKNHRKTLGLMRDIETCADLPGVIRDETRTRLWYRNSTSRSGSMGAVAALNQPQGHPAKQHSINALSKCRNAIVRLAVAQRVTMFVNELWICCKMFYAVWGIRKTSSRNSLHRSAKKRLMN